MQDAEAAVRERAPHLVLCSWMPLGVDWSAAFRAQSSVNEYLLVCALTAAATVLRVRNPIFPTFYNPVIDPLVRDPSIPAPSVLWAM